MRRLYLALFAILAVVLTACGTQSSPSATGQAVSSEPTTSTAPNETTEPSGGLPAIPSDQTEVVFLATGGSMGDAYQNEIIPAFEAAVNPGVKVTYVTGDRSRT